MKIKVLFLAFLIVLSCSVAHAEYKFAQNWTWKDTAYEATVETLIAVDWAQTRWMARQGWIWDDKQHYEMCPWLGKYPSTDAVDTSMITALILHPTIAALLPDHDILFDIKWYNPRRAWQCLVIGVEGGCIINNIAVGVRIEF